MTRRDFIKTTILSLLVTLLIPACDPIDPYYWTIGSSHVARKSIIAPATSSAFFYS